MMVRRENGTNGEPVYKFLGIPIGNYFAPIAGTSLIAIAIWLIQLNADVTWALKNRTDPSIIVALSKDLTNLRDNVNNMQTPLSNRVIMAEGETSRLKTRIDQLGVEVASGSSRCERLWQRVDELRRDLDRVIIKLNPGDDSLVR